MLLSNGDRNREMRKRYRVREKRHRDRERGRERERAYTINKIFIIEGIYPNTVTSHSSIFLPLSDREYSKVEYIHLREKSNTFYYIQ